jgi:hypothetical protein
VQIKLGAIRMYTKYLANIRTVRDYEAFLRLPTANLPDTLDSFAYHLQNQATKIRGSGNDAVFVDVDAHEFANYCRDNGMSPNAHALDHFATEKGQRKG